MSIEYSNRELYKISKKVYREAMLHSQLEAAGSNKAKFLDKIEKNRTNVGTQSVVMKILVSLYMVIFTIIPVTSFTQINVVSQLPFVEDTWNLFAGGLSISAFMLLQPIILIIFSVTFTWGFLSKEPYTWISTLPFSRKEYSKISFFTFSRGIDIQLIAILLVLPVGTMIGINLPKGTGVSLGTNLIMVFVCLIINFANTVFNISIVILLGRRMAKVMEVQEENNQMSNVIRIGSMLAYLLFSMLASYSIQIAIQKIPLLYDPANQFITTNTAEIIIKVLSFIPFPFSGGFLLTGIAIGLQKIPALVVIGSAVGSMLHIGLAFIVFRRALRTLQEIMAIVETERSKKKKEIAEIEVRVSSPIRAYIHRDLALITRELQTVTYMIMPIMIPISTALAFQFRDAKLFGIIPALGLYIFGFAIFSTYFAIMGITSIETGGETITSYLPINVRDQIKAKISFLFSLVPAMMGVALLILIKNPIITEIALMILILLPATLLLGIVGLLFKVFLFGKLKNKYTINEIQTKMRDLKYFVVMILMLVLATGFIFSFLVGFWLPLVIEAIGFLITILVYFRMFPKKPSISLET